MNVLIAPDSFKGSMTSVQAANAIKKGIKKADSTVIMKTLPMADGGEGTLDALAEALKCERIDCDTVDPLGRPILGSFLWHEDKKLAVIETAVASGITLVTEQERNPAKATTHGTGVIMNAAIERGAKEIVIGIGGSATVDGGAGFLQELGVKFFDSNDKEINRITGELSSIYRIDVNDLDPRLEEITITIASDVRNPLLGAEGAITIFGPQKGVSEPQIPDFEEGMRRFSQLTTGVTGNDYTFAEGAGASGGFGFALMAYLNGKMKNGFELIAELTEMDEKIKWADLVISGEGKLDRQTFYGKGPMGVANMAEKSEKPVFLFAGAVTTEFLDEKSKNENKDLVAISILQNILPVEEAMKTGETLLEYAAYKTMKIALIGKKLSL